MISYKLISRVNDMAFYEYRLDEAPSDDQGIIRVNLAEQTGAVVELASGDALHWRLYEQVIREVFGKYQDGILINSGTIG